MIEPDGSEPQSSRRSSGYKRLAVWLAALGFIASLGHFLFIVRTVIEEVPSTNHVNLLPLVIASRTFWLPFILGPICLALAAYSLSRSQSQAYRVIGAVFASIFLCPTLFWASLSVIFLGRVQEKHAPYYYVGDTLDYEGRKYHLISYGDWDPSWGLMLCDCNEWSLNCTCHAFLGLFNWGGFGSSWLSANHETGEVSVYLNIEYYYERPFRRVPMLIYAYSDNPRCYEFPNWSRCIDQPLPR